MKNKVKETKAMYKVQGGLKTVRGKSENYSIQEAFLDALSKIHIKGENDVIKYKLYSIYGTKGTPFIGKRDDALVIELEIEEN